MQIVVIAYGPAGTTSRATRRARNLVGSRSNISVVPAHRGAVDTSSGSPEAIALGTSALQDALDRLDPREPVLLIHDDAVISPRGLRRMTDVLESGEALVVPMTNDVGTDHFHGTLPPVRQAEKLLDDLAAGLERSAAYNVRPTALLGRESTMRSILTEGFLDPFRLLHDPSTSFAVAPTIVAHDGVCTTQLVDPASDPRPLLVATLIVKDEEEMLGDCLRSLEGVVDRIEVCDTGSSDGTIGVASDLGASISSFRWNGDFGAARNHALRSCRDARYVLHIDADERLECPDPEALRRYLATYGDHYSGFQPLIVNNDGQKVTSRFRATRVFPGTGTRFDGRIHELPVTIDDDRPIRGTNINLFQIVHLGYGEQLFRSRDKARRNIDIARHAYEENPGFRTAYDYGRSLLLENAASPLAAGLFEEAFEKIEDGNPQAQAYVYGIVATNRLAAGDVDSARLLARQGLDIVPLEAVAAVAFAKAARAAGTPEDLIALHEWRSQQRSLAPLYEVQGEEAEYLGYAAHAYATGGRLVEAYELLAEAMSRHGAGIQCWAEILREFAGRGFDVLETFGPFTQLAGAERVVREAATVLDPAVTARLAAEYVIRGGSDPDVVAVGLLAGVVSGEHDASSVLASRADVLDQERLDAIALRAEDRGHLDIAARIRSRAA